MGCCMSTPSGSNSPYSGGGSGSARAINESQQTPGISPSSGAGGVGVDDVLPSPSSADPRMRHHHRHHHHHHQPLAQHINKPLRRHEWSSRNRLWTRAALTRERAEFFDTRVTGRQEIWQTLRAALEVLWEADITAAAAAAVKQQQTINSGEQDVLSCQSGSRTEVQDPAIALATAQSILSAADITLPTGDLAQGAYDSLGNYYSLPEYVVSDPSNVVVGRQQKTTEEDMDDMKADLAAAEGEETAEDDEADGLDVMDPDDEEREEVERRREEKGKAVAADVRDLVTIRARLSDGSRDVNVSVGKGETVRSIARYIADEAKLAPNKKVRIAYMGKMLKENLTLPAQGWKQGHVLNALVFNR